MAINIELQNIQTRIGNSFLRAYYPIDYRSNQNILKNIDQLLDRENKGLRSLSGTTSLISQKIGKSLTSLAKEVDEMREASDSLQGKIAAGDEALGQTSKSATDASNALLGFLVAGGFEALRSLMERRKAGGANAPDQKTPPKTNAPDDKTKKPDGKFKIPKSLGVLGLAYELWNMWSELQALDPNTKKSEYRQAVYQIISRAVASLGLAWVGAFLGAIVGGVLGFGAGAVPGFIAGLIGGLVADYTLGDTVDEMVNQVVDYLYTGDEEEEAVDETQGAQDSTISNTEAPAPTPPLEPPLEQAAMATAVAIPLAAPIVGPTPPTPPAEQLVDPPVEYPGPVAPVDLEPFREQASMQQSASGAAQEAENRARTMIPQTTEEQNKLMEEAYGPNTPPGPQTNQANDNQATFDTTSNQAGGIGVQPGQRVSSVQVIEAYGPGRPGRPVQAIRDIAVRAAESVGMTQIKFTSGVGDYISPERRARGQKTTKHSEGIALDVTGFSNQAQKVAFMQAARQLGAGGIGAYNNGSVHIDLGPSREWDGAVGVPGLAEGARVSKPTLALIGEGGEPEYVVPQSKAIKFAHEMLSARPQTRTKKHTHVMVVPILT
jgi:hypothetical protein